MESQRETQWGQLAIPHGRRKDFDKLAPNLSFDEVERELSFIEEVIGGFLGGSFRDGRFNRDAIKGLYQYGFNGSLNWIERASPEVRSDLFVDDFIGVSDINQHIAIYADFEVEPSLGIVAIINAVAARARLDRHRLKGGDEFLSIQEVALLAGMKELSIRNAASPSSSTPLKSTRTGGLSVIEAREADRWLPGRRGYRVTDLPHGEAERNDLFQILDSWVFS